MKYLFYEMYEKIYLERDSEKDATAILKICLFTI